MTLVLVGKDLVLQGLSLKIEGYVYGDKLDSNFNGASSIIPKQLQVKIREYDSYFFQLTRILFTAELNSQSLIHLEAMYGIYPRMFEDSRVPETAIGIL